MPAEQRRRGHREHLGPSPPGDQPGQCREPQPVGRLVADPADLAAQYRVLVPEHQEFGILGQLTPSQHLEAGEQTACDQVDARGDHSGMISARKPGQARSNNNRAPQGRCQRLAGSPRRLTARLSRRAWSAHRVSGGIPTAGSPWPVVRSGRRCSGPSAGGRAGAACSCRTFSRSASGVRLAASRASRERPRPSASAG